MSAFAHWNILLQLRRKCAMLWAHDICMSSCIHLCPSSLKHSAAAVWGDWGVLLCYERIMYAYSPICMSAFAHWKILLQLRRKCVMLWAHDVLDLMYACVNYKLRACVVWGNNACVCVVSVSMCACVHMCTHDSAEVCVHVLHARVYVCVILCVYVCTCVSSYWCFCVHMYMIFWFPKSVLLTLISDK